MSSDLAPRLDSAYVEETVGRLEARIRARFPDRRLGDAAHSLRTAVPQIHEGFEASKSRRRHIRWAARAASAVIVLAALAALVLALRDPVLHGTDSSVDWLPIIESTVNDLIFGSIAVFFLWALPERLERRTLLDLLHRLRSLAHVVDMHQLDKDPEQARRRLPPDLGEPGPPDHGRRGAAPLPRLLQRAGLAHRQDGGPVRGADVRPGGARHGQRDRDRDGAHVQKIWQKISLLPEHG